MIENSAIERIRRTNEAFGGPVTRQHLVRDLRALGVTPGMLMLAHSSLKAIGSIVGGAQTVIEALLEAIGDDGTLVMPTHTSHLSDPANWKNPPVPESWWGVMREHMPPFDPCLTESAFMGAIPEHFRRLPGVLRSAHPQTSFAARGPHAREIVRDHPLDRGLGDGSPLARVYDLGGHILLLGVGHEKNTSLHLSEHRATWPGKRMTNNGAPMFVGGEREWVAWQELDIDSDDFGRIGEAFASQSGLQQCGPAGLAAARLMPQRALVDFGAAWMSAHRA